MRQHSVPHPGEILLEYVTDDTGPALIKKSIPDISDDQYEAILNGTQSITQEIAKALSQELGTSADFWMNVQASYDACINKLP